MDENGNVFYENTTGAKNTQSYSTSPQNSYSTQSGRAKKSLIGTYEIKVSHIGENLYKEVSGTNVLIKTQNCYIYKYNTAASLEITRNTPPIGQLHFLASKRKCKVEAIVNNESNSAASKTTTGANDCISGHWLSKKNGIVNFV